MCKIPLYTRFHNNTIHITLKTNWHLKLSLARFKIIFHRTACFSASVPGGLPDGCSDDLADGSDDDVTSSLMDKRRDRLKSETA